MTRREIAEVACRILALAMFGYGWVAICSGVAYVGILWPSHSSDYLLSDRTPLLGGIGWAIASALIWFRAPVYAARMMDDDPEPIVATGLTSLDMLALASVVVGVWMAAPAFVEVMSFGLEWIILSQDRDEPADSSREAFARLVDPLLRFLSGAYLMLGRRGIAQGILRLRTAGTERALLIDDEHKQSDQATADASVEVAADELPLLLPSDEENRS